MEVNKVKVDFRTSIPQDLGLIGQFFSNTNQYDLLKSFSNPLILWTTGIDKSEENNGKIFILASAIIESKQHLAKINQLFIHPQYKNSDFLKQALTNLLAKIKEKFPQTDIVYMTTPHLNIEDQEATIDIGFKVLGAFPGRIGRDKKILGLTAYFYNGTLEQKRLSSFSLHSKIAPIFQLIQNECQLSPNPIQQNIPSLNIESFDPLPPLELIQAPQFVAHQYQKLTERKFLSINFYPYQTPNLLVCDPRQQIKIFLKALPELNFATIIGENINLLVNPVELYKKAIQILKQHNIYHIELINDAADLLGIDCILRAGFRPCAYFPAMKVHGNNRRDYIIFAKSFSSLVIQPNEINHRYADYLSLWQ